VSDDWPKAKALGLTAIASLIIWCATYSALRIAVGPDPDRPGNLFDIALHSIILFLLGWIVAGLGYLLSGFKMRAPTAARTAIGASLIFALMMGVGIYKEKKERLAPTGCD
jgi:hypothetical protein